MTDKNAVKMRSKIKKNKSLIPKGIYCYHKPGRIDPCVYWELRGDKPYQENGYCHFMGHGDWEVDELSLLWDQVKECGINENLSESF